MLGLFPCLLRKLLTFEDNVHSFCKTNHSLRLLAVLFDFSKRHWHSQMCHKHICVYSSYMYQFWYTNIYIYIYHIYRYMYKYIYGYLYMETCVCVVFDVYSVHLTIHGGPWTALSSQGCASIAVCHRWTCPLPKGFTTFSVVEIRRTWSSQWEFHGGCGVEVLFQHFLESSDFLFKFMCSFSWFLDVVVSILKHIFQEW